MPAPQGEHASVLGRVAPGNIDLAHRPKVRNRGGSYSTVRSVSFGTPQGEVLVPTVIKLRGKWSEVSPRAAFQHYRRTGQHLGIFSNIASANRYANSLHRDQAKKYGR